MSSNTISREAVVFLVTLMLATPVAADRHAPSKTREAVVGCWDAKAGASLTLSAFGKHSATFTVRFSERPRAGPERMTGQAIWMDGEYEVVCRPRSQHGTFCRISPAPAGLRIRVFSKRHRDQTRGALVEDFIAQPCAQ